MTASTAVHSNAFNFMSFIQNGVDPRTGQYTMAINLPALQSYDLNGPEFPVALNYNPLNTQDSGYGLGWDLKLSQYTPSTFILALSSGETFKVTGTGSQPAIKEKKLDSFRFLNDGNHHYRVVHKSGLVEHLQLYGGAGSATAVALPRFIDSPQGHRLTLEYEAFASTFRLKSVSDGTGAMLLSITRTAANVVHIDQRPQAGAGGASWARYSLELDPVDYRANRIVLPTEPQASWRLDYELIRGILCVKTVHSPTGSVERLEHSDGGHLFPDGARQLATRTSGRKALSARALRGLARLDKQLDQRRGLVTVARPALPRVTRHRTEPGFNQPAIDVRYSYVTDATDDDANFLGFGAQGVVWDSSGLDNLYQATNHYSYGSTERLMVGDIAVRTVQRTFNRYHLLVEEKTTRNDSIQTVATTYHIRENLPFDLQPPQCQLPSEVKTTWTHTADGNSRSEVEYSSFDDSGNPVRSVSANGVTEVSSWYPAQGADGCPADPWGFSRYLEERTVTPANASHADAPVLTTRYRYETQQPVQGGVVVPWIAPVSEVLVQVEGNAATEVQRTESSYVHAPTDPATHGRLKAATLTLNGLSSVTEYGYSKFAADSTLQTTETLTTHDGLKKVTVRLESVLTGNTLLDRDDNNVVIKTTYDTLNRVTAETAAPDTPEEATRHYEYLLVNAVGGQASQKVVDVKGVQTVTRFDGLNRAIYEERQQADATQRADAFLQTYAATYDALGQLVTETEYDWRLGDAPEIAGLKFKKGHFNWLADEPFALTTTFKYDDWGQQVETTGPDGVIDHEQNNPITQVATAWREGMGKTLTTNDLFGNPVRIERKTVAGVSLGAQINEYDGLGRLRKGIDAQRNVTSYTYDVFDRLTLNVLPDLATVEREYALHSSEDLPTRISVKASGSSTEKLLGTQTFDGLSRMTRSVTGNRSRAYEYIGSQAQPSYVHTPGGATIEYDYSPHLSDEPVARRVGGVAAGYSLDPHNARLLSGTESAHKLERQYYSTGELKSERREQAGDSHDMQYCYSLRGRLLSYTDVLGNTQTHDYDAAGRLVGTTLGSTVSVLTYNARGLNDLIDTQDSAINQQLKVQLQYDDFGREIERLFDYGAGLTQTLTQGYNVLDQMTTRVLSEAGAVLRDEEFIYDQRGRLASYEVEGPEAPFDPAGKQIIQQAFLCDELDNHEVVLTSFVGGENWADYSYSDQDPAQLVEISNDHDAYAAFNLQLTYDANGNLTKDEAGRVLQYDALSRLIKVTPDDGSAALDYGYDAVDILSSAANERRFYRAGELANLVEGSEGRTFMRAGEALLAEHQGGLAKPAQGKATKG